MTVGPKKVKYFRIFRKIISSGHFCLYIYEVTVSVANKSILKAKTGSSKH
jgi:hypothetical protein